jgi:hypothetical protein
MLDDRVAIWWCQFLSDCLAVVGTFGLVVYTYPYLGLAFIPLGLFFVRRIFLDVYREGI